MSFSPQLLLTEPTPLDPSVSNAWAAILNTNFSLIDSAVSAITSIALPAQGGYPTVVLTSTSGAADQARNQHFNFTGVLTAATLVLWPQSLSRFFSVKNSCTGSFALTLGANNGSGAAGGSTYVIPQGFTMLLFSDGTNVLVRPADAVSIQGRFVSSSAPTDGQVMAWNNSTSRWEPASNAAGGDVVGPGSATDDDLATFDGTTGKLIQDSGVGIASVARLTVPNQVITGGAVVTSIDLGTISSGTLTVNCGSRPSQFYTNNGNHAVQAPGADGSTVILMTNGAAAGTVTFTGFNVGSNTGGTLTTTNGAKFSIFVWRSNAISGYFVFAHQ